MLCDVLTIKVDANRGSPPSIFLLYIILLGLKKVGTLSMCVEFEVVSISASKYQLVTTFTLSIRMLNYLRMNWKTSPKITRIYSKTAEVLCMRVNEVKRKPPRVTENVR